MGNSLKATAGISECVLFNIKAVAGTFCLCFESRGSPFSKQLQLWSCQKRMICWVT